MTSKYRNVKTVIDGFTFASKAEANRYAELCLLKKAGVISGLILQPKYPLEVMGQKIGTYIGDFQYTEGNQLFCEDVKGVRTPVYNIKKKLVKALYGVTIKEVRA